MNTVRLGKQTVASLLVAGFLLPVCAGSVSSGLHEEIESSFDHGHTALTLILERYVEDGLVDYVGMGNDRAGFDEYLLALSIVDSTEFLGFSPGEQLAFLINAYNAYTLELILRHYPVQSIREIPGAWDTLRWSLLGRQFTLNDIEHELIRSMFDEPRIHMALVCASIGCPALRPQAYRSLDLEEQLSEVSRAFVRDEAKNRLDTESDVLFVSKIFEWYGDDFSVRWGETEVPSADASRKNRAILGFFLEYHTEETATFLESRRVSIQYLDYDWNLNRRDVK